MSAELSIRENRDTEHFRSVPHPFIDLPIGRLVLKETDTYIHTYMFSYFLIPVI